VICGSRRRRDVIDVPVVLGTYNHAAFVAKAIESMLDQRTAKPF
jgi:hypothetical protein